MPVKALLVKVTIIPSQILALAEVELIIGWAGTARAALTIAAVPALTQPPAFKVVTV